MKRWPCDYTMQLTPRMDGEGWSYSLYYMPGMPDESYTIVAATCDSLENAAKAAESHMLKDIEKHEPQTGKVIKFPKVDMSDA